MAGVRMLVLLCTVVVVVVAARQQQDCRLCPESCQTVPRADGSCPVCICNGVALTDCGSAPTECSESCQVKRGVEGCLECSCLPPDSTLCPSVGACPEECQQLVGGRGCPECVCDVPKPFCPPIECPEDCTLVEQEGRCPSCRCDRPLICPAIPECLRGCIDRDQERECFICNCTLAPSQPPQIGFAPPDASSPGPSDQRPSDSESVDEDFSYERNPAGGDSYRPDGDGHPAPDRGNPVARCRNQRLKCPAGCLIGIAAHGCRECYCGANAVICPEVQPCESRCQYMSPEDGCCSCKCSQRPASHGVTITSKKITPALPPPFLSYYSSRRWMGGSPYVGGVYL